MDHAEFGALLRTRRVAAGWSLRGLARRADVNHGSLSHAEAGDRQRGLGYETVCAVDTALGVRGELIDAWHTLPADSARKPEPAPNQLPPAPTLVGRDELLDTILEAAGQTPEQVGGRSPTVLLLTGPGGVGKTALAIAAAHTLASPAQGVLFTDLRGWHPTLAPRPLSDVLHRWTRALGASVGEASGDHEDLVALWRSMTIDRRIVAVLDNARPDQVADLLPASSACTILVTSRDRMIDTEVPLRRLTVPPLPQHDALHVLSLHSGLPPHVVAPLADRCAGLPLALRVAGEDAGAHWQAEEIPEMAQSWDRLPHQSAIDRATELSYRRLSPETARAWRLLAHVGDPSLGAAAAALNTTPTVARSWLHEALRANLLDRDGQTWAYHDLHRAYALRMSRSSDTQAEINEVVYRALIWFLHGLAAADRWFAPSDDQPEIVALPADVTAPEFVSYDEAYSWIDARWPSLVPAVQLAIEYGWVAIAWQLAAITSHYAFLTKPWASWSHACRLAGEAAREHGDLTGHGWMEFNLGSIAGDQEDYDEAIRHTDLALDLRRHLGDQRGLGWTAIDAVRWRLALGAPSEDIDPLIDEIIAAHSAIDLQAGVCLGWTFRGTLTARTGDLATAIEQLHHALEGIEELGVPAVYCYVHTRLAETEVRAGYLQAARDHAARAEEHAQRAGADWFRLGALATMADTYDPASPDERRQLWQVLHLAVTLADKLGDPREPELRQRLDTVEP